jgi:hypothetical protein
MADSRPMSTLPPTDPPAAPAADRASKGVRTGLVLTVLAVSALVGAWVYVLFIYDPGLMIDELGDRTFPVAAEQVCAVTVTQLEELPPANLATSADDRADTVERSNAYLLQMVDELRPLTPEGPPDERAGVEEWLDDWVVYIGDRQQYVDNLRRDDDARFLESTKGAPNRGITRAINGFAEVNRMESCSTPGDLS